MTLQESGEEYGEGKVNTLAWVGMHIASLCVKGT